MKKILLSALAVSFVSVGLMAQDETKIYNPKAEKNHLVIKMEILGEKGNTPAGEIVNLCFILCH